MNSLVVSENRSPVQFDAGKIELIKRTVAAGASDLELQLFVEQCKRTGLDPITRQIYFIKNPKDGKVQIQTSIDGFRLVAERSGQYEGQTQPQWCGEDGVWRDFWVGSKPPVAARVRVLRSDWEVPATGVAMLEEKFETEDKEEFEKYKAETNALVLWFPQ